VYAFPEESMRSLEFRRLARVLIVARNSPKLYGLPRKAIQKAWGLN
jgi:hypothetical protein